MATVYQTPVVRSVDDSDMGIGVVLGIFLAVVLAALFFVYALPMLLNNIQPAASPNETRINIESAVPAN